MHNNQIVIVGAGIEGLTAAVLLSENRRKVTVITKDDITQTNSANATASWYMPGNNKPILQRLCIDSLPKWIELSKKPGTGVFIGNAVYYFKTKEDFKQTSWANKEIQKPLEISYVLPEDPKFHPNFPIAITAKVPVIVPHIYLKYLQERLFFLGGKLIKKKVDKLADLSSSFQIIINCTGWEAKELTNDPSVFPIRGQLEVGKTNFISANRYSLHFKDLNAYAVFRQPSDELVLGTTYQENNSNKEKSVKDKEDILKKCAQFVAVEEFDKTSSQVGIRCGRDPDVRIDEKLYDEGYVIINCYGHDGCGYAASWGSAYQVLEFCNKYNDVILSKQFRCSL